MVKTTTTIKVKVEKKRNQVSSKQESKLPAEKKDVRFILSSSEKERNTRDHFRKLKEERLKKKTNPLRNQ